MTGMQQSQAFGAPLEFLHSSGLTRLGRSKLVHYAKSDRSWAESGIILRMPVRLQFSGHAFIV